MTLFLRIFRLRSHYVLRYGLFTSEPVWKYKTMIGLYQPLTGYYKKKNFSHIIMRKKQMSMTGGFFHE